MSGDSNLKRSIMKLERCGKLIWQAINMVINIQDADSLKEILGKALNELEKALQWRIYEAYRTGKLTWKEGQAEGGKKRHLGRCIACEYFEYDEDKGCYMLGEDDGVGWCRRHNAATGFYSTCPDWKRKGGAK